MSGPPFSTHFILNSVAYVGSKYGEKTSRCQGEGWAFKVKRDHTKAQIDPGRNTKGTANCAIALTRKKQ